MNYPSDPSRIEDRKMICRSCRKARYHFRRCKLASLRAARLMPPPNTSAIWYALRPNRAFQLADRATRRMQEISLAHYRLYTAAANRFLQID